MDVNALTAELAGKLGLKESAQRDAAAGIPARDATEPTGAEVTAVAEAEKAGQKAVKTLGIHCQETEGAIRKCGSVLADVRKRRQAADDQPPSASDLEILRIARDGAVAAYNRFKSDNGLLREASGDDRFVQIIWALVIMVVEGAFNSYFFAPASEYGIAGGFFAAFFFSFANVACAFVGGALGLRYANHCDPAKKLAGALCGIACILGCAVVVSLSAWYRGHIDLLRAEASETLALDAWRASIESLRGVDLWGLIASLHAFLLMFVGALCALFGFWKGYEFDDTYPGFGGMFRQKEEATENYNDAKAEHDERMKAWRNGRNGALREMGRDLEQTASAMRVAHEGFRREMASANLSVQAAQLARGLLSVYRQENTAIRADSPPSYFGKFPGEDKFHGLDGESRRWREKCEKLESEVARLADECRDESGEIQRELNHSREA